MSNYVELVCEKNPINDKISFRVQELELEKETAKQIVVRGTSSYVSHIRKSDLGILKREYSMTRTVITYNTPEAIAEAKEKIRASIAREYADLQVTCNYLEAMMKKVDEHGKEEHN